MEDLGAGLQLVTAPTQPRPVTAEEVKLHARVGTSAEDLLIQTYIDAAVLRFQAVTGRQILEAIYDLYLDRFPSCNGALELPIAPVTAVTSVTWYDTGDTATVIPASAYLADLVREPPRIVLRSGQSWPTATLRAAQGAVIRLTAGATDDPAQVAADVKHALYQAVATYYLRGAVDPSVDGFFRPFAPVRLA